MRSHFEEIVQNFELKRFGGALKGHQLTPICRLVIEQMFYIYWWWHTSTK